MKARTLFAALAGAGALALSAGAFAQTPTPQQRGSRRLTATRASPIEVWVSRMCSAIDVRLFRRVEGIGLAQRGVPDLLVSIGIVLRQHFVLQGWEMFQDDPYCRVFSTNEPDPCRFGDA